MKKYNAGDLVTINLDRGDAENLNSHNGCWFVSRQIKKHEPAPFNWADVKPGMAFTNQYDHIRWYVGPSLGQSYLVHMAHGVSKQAIEICVPESKNNLTRAPEHDIEVKP